MWISIQYNGWQFQRKLKLTSKRQREIKDLVLKKSKTVIFYGIEYKNDDHQIATQFNNYFVNSIKSINNIIEDVQYVSNLPVITNIN